MIGNEKIFGEVWAGMRLPQGGGFSRSLEQAHSDVYIIGGVYSGGVRKPLQLYCEGREAHSTLVRTISTPVSQLVGRNETALSPLPFNHLSRAHSDTYPIGGVNKIGSFHHTD